MRVECEPSVISVNAEELNIQHSFMRKIFPEIRMELKARTPVSTE